MPRETEQQMRDRDETLRNRSRLQANRNLLLWYRELYRDQFKDLPDPSKLSILEIGSGTSPLKEFYPNIITSDVFDCHDIGRLEAIKDNSLDAITLTNVLHHLKSPIAFLNSAAPKLKRGGKVIATEPFFSLLSTPIWKHLHHEPVDFQISEPELMKVQGPLSSANQAAPWLIFFRRRDWLQRLNESFDVANFSARPFSALSYMATGGISHKLPVPHFFYRTLLPVDLALSRCFPHVCAAFFTVTLTRL
jgi:SAM-dependent methyltransferase